MRNVLRWMRNLNVRTSQELSTWKNGATSGRIAMMVLMNRIADSNATFPRPFADGKYHPTECGSSPTNHLRRDSENHLQEPELDTIYMVLLYSVKNISKQLMDVL